MRNRKLRKEKKKNKIRKIIRGFILIVFLGLAIDITIGVYKENRIKLKDESDIELQADQNEQIRTKKKKEEVNISSDYKGYEVIAKLEIPSVKIETLVLKDNTKEAMEISTVKFWGAQPNEIGNFCIAGHNYKKSNMFYNLFYLKKGEKLYLSDNKNGKYTYTINDIYRVKPQNTSPIEQDTNGKRVITLITCANYSKNRLIIQAVEDN